MSPNPELTTLASGKQAKVLIMRPKAAAVDRGFLDSPTQAEERVAQILHEARIGAPLTPVPGPHHPLRRPEQISHPELGDVDVFSERGKAALLAKTLTQAPLFLLRNRSVDLEEDTLAANSNYFLFGKSDLDAPWNAYGDPIGLVLSGGEVFYPPQLPRACLLWSGARAVVRRLCFDEIQIVLPNGTSLRPHAFGAAGDKASGAVFARYFGSEDGRSPDGNGYDIAYIGQHPAAGAPAGGMPLPRAGCVVRFASREVAIAALGPLHYRLSEAWQEGIQAGPQVLTGGEINDTGPDVFTVEHMTESDALPEAGTVSPAGWKANWDATQAARLGAGVTSDGDLVFAAVEGTSSHLGGQAMAKGATLRDLAQILGEIGCTEALHLDGGGSTQVFGQAGGALIAPTDVHHGMMDRAARYDRPVPTWLHLKC